MAKRAYDFVTFGEVLWDIFVTDGEFTGTPGGAPANVAVHLARMGFRSAVIGGLGDDFLGRTLADRLRGEGVDTKTIVVKKEKTGIAMIERKGGEPSFLFYRHHTADLTIRAREIPACTSRVRVLTSATMASPNMTEATRAVLSRVRAKVTVVDLNVRPKMFASAAVLRRQCETLVRRADWIKGSRVDFAHLGLRSDRAIRAWAQRLSPGAVVTVTDAAKPAKTWLANDEIVVPSKKVDLIDATGGGDAFLAGTMAVLFSGGRRSPGNALPTDPQSWQEAMKFGQDLAGKTVSRLGALSATKSTAALRRALHSATRNHG